MSARLEILARIRASLPKSALPQSSFEEAQEDPLCFEGTVAWRARLKSELVLVGAEVFDVDSAQALLDQLEREIGESSLLSWDPSLFPKKIWSFIEARRVPEKASLSERARADFGVTGVDAAIAETGTLALFSSKERPREASLLPTTHIALVDQSTIVPTMGRFFRNEINSIRRSSAVAMISGPSRTADIELALTMGVHGPRRLLVILMPADLV